jgi:hypothetical protein
MSLSKSERSAINKANAAKSTGPVTDAGKNISKRNSTKHGLTAKQITLPDDDPAVVQALLDEWHADFRPRNAAEKHLVEQCAYAALLQNRVARAHCAAVADQVHRAEADLEAKSEQHVRDMLALMRSDLATAVAGLGRSARGLEYLLERWEHLGEQLRRNGSWAVDQASEAIRLTGRTAEIGLQNPDLADASYVRLDSTVARRGPDDHQVKFLLDPHRCPPSAREHFEDFELPTREEALGHLTALVDENVAAVRQRLERARPIAEAENSNARVRALTLRDDREARLMIRYQSEARLAFHRSYDALRKSLKEEVQECSTYADSMAEGRPALAEPVAHEEAPEAASAEPAEVDIRNKPNSAATPVEAKASAAKNRPPAGLSHGVTS